MHLKSSQINEFPKIIHHLAGIFHQKYYNHPIINSKIIYHLHVAYIFHQNDTKPLQQEPIIL